MIVERNVTEKFRKLTEFHIMSDPYFRIIHSVDCELNMMLLQRSTIAFILLILFTGFQGRYIIISFCNKIFRGFTSTEGQNPRFSIDFAGHHYNSAAPHSPRSLFITFVVILLTLLLLLLFVIIGVINVFEQAYNCIEEMRSNAPKVSIANYIDRGTLEAIHRALNIPFKDAPVTTSNGYHGYAINGDDEEEGEVVDEDVIAD